MGVLWMLGLMFYHPLWHVIFFFLNWYLKFGLTSSIWFLKLQKRFLFIKRLTLQIYTPTNKTQLVLKRAMGLSKSLFCAIRWGMCCGFQIGRDKLGNLWLICVISKSIGLNKKVTHLSYKDFKIFHLFEMRCSTKGQG